MELLLSDTWGKKSDETVEIFMAREKSTMNTWSDIVKKHGQCYVVKFGENDIRPMWEDEINIGDLVKQIVQPIYVALNCPLCQPYDYFDIQTSSYPDRRYLTKIINPRYPEGFIDKGGVWTRCPCIVKGEHRKYLKFKGLRT